MADPINFQSALPALLPLLQAIIGGKETGKTTGGETTTTTADTSALTALLGTLQGPNNLEQVVAQMFAQGAAKVPELTTQFANATGTRTTNNSMLAGSLANLNTTLAQAIAQYVSQQQIANQQIQANVAGKIADATKTTNVVKDVGTTKTTGMNPNTTKSLLPALLAGVGLNKIGKMDSTPADTTMTPPSSQGLVQPDFGAYNEGPTAFQVPGVSIGDTNTASFDTSNAASAAVETFPVADVADIPSTPIDVGDLSGAEDVFDVGDMWFADGGLIGRRQPAGYADGGVIHVPIEKEIADTRKLSAVDFQRARAIALAEALDNAKPRKAVDSKGENNYADGGVIRNVNNVAPDPTQILLQALSSSPTVSKAPTILDALAAPKTKREGQGAESGGGSGGSGSTGDTPGAGVTDAPGTPSGNAGVEAIQALSPLSVALFALNPLAQLPMLLAKEVAKNLFNTNNPATMPPAVSDGGSTTAPAPAPANEGSVGIGDDTDTGPNSASVDAATSPSTGSPDGPSTGAPDGGTGSDSGDGGGAYASGGLIKGKGGPRSDRVVIHASPNEYMLPADVVDYIGIDVLDNLVHTIHSPLSGGTK